MLSLFLCSSLSPFNSLSPITCPVLLFLAGVPMMSAGEAMDILPSFTDFSVTLLCSGSFSTGLSADLLLSSLTFLAFLIFSSWSLSGERNTFGLGLLVGVFSSFSDTSSSSSSSSLPLLSRQRELDRLAWMARLTDLSVLMVMSDLDTTVWDWAWAVGTLDM